MTAASSQAASFGWTAACARSEHLANSIASPSARGWRVRTYPTAAFGRTNLSEDFQWQSSKEKSPSSPAAAVELVSRPPGASSTKVRSFTSPADDKRNWTVLRL